LAPPCRARCPRPASCPPAQVRTRGRAPRAGGLAGRVAERGASIADAHGFGVGVPAQANAAERWRAAACPAAAQLSGQDAVCSWDGWSWHAGGVGLVCPLLLFTACAVAPNWCAQWWAVRSGWAGLVWQASRVGVWARGGREGGGRVHKAGARCCAASHAPVWPPCGPRAALHASPHPPTPAARWTLPLAALHSIRRSKPSARPRPRLARGQLGRFCKA
jgi:hypothetical protein